MDNSMIKMLLKSSGVNIDEITGEVKVMVLRLINRLDSIDARLQRMESASNTMVDTEHFVSRSN